MAQTKAELPNQTSTPESIGATGLAHGLDGASVEPDWPVLTLEEVAAVLQQFPALGRASRLLSISPRPFSAASRVLTERQQVFVKRHARVVRDAAALAEEHRFLAHLGAGGAPVPHVLTDQQGGTAIQAGDWTYEVHSVPPGIDLYEDVVSWMPFMSTAHARAAGRIIARLHAAAQDYDAPARKNRPLVAGFTIFADQDPRAALEAYTAVRPSLQRYLGERDCAEEALMLLEPYHRELAPILSSLPSLWTHNDLHPSNMLWSGASESAAVAAVIDFGLADRTNAVHDLAHAIERSIVEWLALVNNPSEPHNVPIHFEHLFALLEGYESVRSLTTEEAAALAPMVALCHAEFALSETDYFLAALHSPEKAYMACEGYLVAHARWFRGAGAKLLDALRRWADTRPAIVPETR